MSSLPFFAFSAYHSNRALKDAATGSERSIVVGSQAFNFGVKGSLKDYQKATVHLSGSLWPIHNNEDALKLLEQLVQRNRPALNSYFGADLAHAIWLPIPSSTTTAATVHQPWNACIVADRLQAVLGGTVVCGLANVVATTPGHNQSVSRLASDIFANLQLLASVPQDRPLFLVDDTVTHGRHAAAAVELLAANGAGHVVKGLITACYSKSLPALPFGQSLQGQITWQGSGSQLGGVSRNP